MRKKAREVFIPAWEECTGVNGIPLVELHYHKDMPGTMPARTRLFQLSVVKAAYKLWCRMTSYNVVLLDF